MTSDLRAVVGGRSGNGRQEFTSGNSDSQVSHLLEAPAKKQATQSAGKKRKTASLRKRIEEDLPPVGEVPPEVADMKESDLKNV